MKASDPQPPAAASGTGPARGGGGPGATDAPTWLLIGNSRWHWAGHGAAGRRFWHQHPAEAVATLRPPPLAWAAVGPLPQGLALPPERRLTLASVPLRQLPPWLGIDRALVGWQAWSESAGRPVLVADAGTVLSLTRVSADGAFAGGRLLAGLALQLRAMAAGTAALPELEPPGGGSGVPNGGAGEAAQAHGGDRPGEAGQAGGGSGSGEAGSAEETAAWPHTTAEAMRQGTARGLAAAILAASLEARQELGGCRLVLTGGDAVLMRTLLQTQAAAAGVPVELSPDLALEALMRLRPAPA